MRAGQSAEPTSSSNRRRLLKRWSRRILFLYSCVSTAGVSILASTSYSDFTEKRTLRRQINALEQHLQSCESRLLSGCSRDVDPAATRSVNGNAAEKNRQLIESYFWLQYFQKLLSAIRQQHSAQPGSFPHQASAGAADSTAVAPLESEDRETAEHHKDICLAAVLGVRLYADDKAHLTALELEQWIRYMQHAGVDRIYLYDKRMAADESLALWASQLFESGTVVYHDWVVQKRSRKSQLEANQHAIDKYKGKCDWMMTFDMDEYPFVHGDQEAGFLKRFVEGVLSIDPAVSQLVLQNFVFSGIPKAKTWLVERFQRRFPSKFNDLTKTIFKASCVRSVDIHKQSMKSDCGRTLEVPDSVARMNHYWGARLLNFATEETEESLKETVIDQDMLPVVGMLNGTLQSLQFPAPGNIRNAFWTDPASSPG
eukprot:TRINITY_DN22144_c0_g1_i2.p1 TRINITY_DN22144_c0_g1~~TRINITY_DN22144_c0_g1_i2.p1  ORF type:complete len:447 (+),score=55.47 TRINITY_DN22144_c0_g1_i2:63-1343(+)